MKALNKDSIKEIKNSFKRYLSILLIVLLGVGFFAGIKATSPDMQQTLNKYYEDNNVFDLEIVSTLGLTDTDIEEIKKIDGVEQIEGSYSSDAIVSIEENEYVTKLHSIPSDINKIDIVKGRLPESENECVVEEKFIEGTGKNIGDVIELNIEENEEGESVLKNNEMTIVGTIKSPLYISNERGSSKLGAGKINYYIYVPKNAINSEIYTELYLTINSEKLSSFSSKYDDEIEILKDNIEKIADERKEARYNELKDEANAEVDKAQKELDDKKAEVEKQLNDAQVELDNAKKELEDGKNKISESEEQIRINQQKANNEFASAEKQIADAKAQIESKENELENAKAQLSSKESEAETGIASIEQGINQIDESIATLEKQKEQLEQMGQDTTQIQNAINEANNKKSELNNQKTSIEQQLNDARAQIELGNQQIDNAKEQIASQENTLKSEKNKANREIANAKNEIEKAKQELIDGENEIKEGESQLETKKQEAQQELDDAQNKIDDAKDKVNDIKKPDWYILDRDSNTGYISYSQDTERIANIGKVFPVVFFVVAALISLTSMTRMVEEQRTQIGTLKALGYNKLQIASKYILYALSATVIGSILGMFVGFYTIPVVIFNMYRMMYDVPEFIQEFNSVYAIGGLVIALLCTVGATIYSCTRELRSTPSVLMRPKAPKVGKKVLLERINFIWSRLKFTQKVTVRNIFRYKKRFLMTIIGIAGCTALIVAGFGLRGSVGRLIPLQYGEIFKYDLSISFNDDTSREDIDESFKNIENLEEIEKAIKINLQYIDILDKNNKNDIQLIIPENVNEFNNYVMLQNEKTKDNYILNDEGVIITQKLSELLDINIGDTIKIENSNDVVADVKVVGITRNYLMHYMYMSPEFYNKIYGENVKYNTIYTIDKSLSREQEDILGKKILENSNVSNISFISVTKGLFDDVMKNMIFVVFILIISAGLLAFVVLYNLSNVNISERIRELATIKVLGFYNKEVYKYVGRETTILTIIGIVVGLVAGYFLNSFIIKTCELDILMFDPTIEFTSYLYSVLLTVIFTIIVNITTYFALKKINMVESLKSIE